jgi:CspA family cold shock protein
MQATSTRLEGSVKWFDNKRGFGFILRPGHTDVFVHYSSINGGGYKTLTEGDQVTYVLEENGKGPRATDVTRAHS